MAEVELKDNIASVLSALDDAVKKSLKECGMAGETYAKNYFDKYSPPAVETGALKGSISHEVDSSANTVTIGSAMNYAIYVEFGTGSANVAGGTTKESWIYKGEDGKFHRAYPMKARPFIKPAVANHTQVYLDIIKRCLKGG